MKRLSVHAVFALTALAAAAVVGAQALRLQQVRQLNAAVAAAAQAPVLPRLPVADAASASVSAAASSSDPGTASDAGASTGTADRDDLVDAPRAVRLARATALSKAGAFDAAFKLYSGLIEPGALDAIGQQALFNLGNMSLRQGLATGAASADAGPLIELAKQRYRDLLRAAPHDWDARYNLERALRVAPEETETVAEESNVPAERRNVQMRGMDAGDLP